MHSLITPWGQAGGGSEGATQPWRNRPGSTLEQDGYRMVTGRDGKSGLSLARLECPALIFLDWQTPGADGIEVTRTL
jgi:DNA-binding response OmpR family regulator